MHSFIIVLCARTIRFCSDDVPHFWFHLYHRWQVTCLSTQCFHSVKLWKNPMLIIHQYLFPCALMFRLLCTNAGLLEEKFKQFLSGNKKTCRLQTGSKEQTYSSTSCVVSTETPLRSGNPEWSSQSMRCEFKNDLMIWCADMSGNLHRCRNWICALRVTYTRRRGW